MKTLTKKFAVSMMIAGGVLAGSTLTAPEASASAIWARGFQSLQECNSWIFNNQFPGKNARCEYLSPSNEYAVFYDGF